jgi:hypothetical protein
MSFENHNERRDAAAAAKKAMLEKFKQKASAPVDPAVAAQKAAEAKAREEKRVEAEKRRRERVEMEKLERRAEAEAIRLAAEEDERKRIADAEAAEILAFEQKARRDLRYAARKARQK